jgi:hypothetical protein
VKLTILVVLAIAAAGLVPAAQDADAARPQKQPVCHLDATDPATPTWVLIELVPAAVASHLSHGDAFPGEPVPGMPGYSFDDSCSPVRVGTMLAVAYTDMFDDGLQYDPLVDVLIAALIDGNGDGVLSTGDHVVTSRYPRDFEASTFGSFGVTQFTIPETWVTEAGPDLCVARTWDLVDARTIYEWKRTAAEESYRETTTDGITVGGTTFFRDGLLDKDENTSLIQSGSPSRPGIDTPEVSVTDPGDDGFVDVELHCAGSG